MDIEKEVKNEGVNRRTFLGAAAAAISAGAVLAPFALGQSVEQIRKGEMNHSKSNIGPVNQPLLQENPDAFLPPPTDHGDVPPFWYSFDLSHRRVEDGGWTRQVTQRELPTSNELAGVNMRLEAGAYRELHWHVADEWAIMLKGNCRVTCLNPDGTIFIDDVKEGDLWYFPAGFPHSLQGLGPDGCEFLLVFDQALFSEYLTFLISDWTQHTPPDVLEKNMKLPADVIAKMPQEELYIFPSPVPGSLAADKEAVGGDAVASKIQYTFRALEMEPTKQSAGGSVRVVDSTVFPAARNIAMAYVVVKPGSMREMHWHPGATEWQYWMKGTGRMTVFAAKGSARTQDFNPNDVGFVPPVCGHYIENTGTEDLVFLEMFKTSKYEDFSFDQWVRRLPPEIIKNHLNIDRADWEKIPGDNKAVIVE
jgi:oxalate decarboxylase